MRRTPKADMLQLLLEEWPELKAQDHRKEDAANRAPVQNGKKNGFRPHMNGHTHPTSAAAMEKVESFYITSVWLLTAQAELH